MSIFKNILLCGALASTLAGAHAASTQTATPVAALRQATPNIVVQLNPPGYIVQHNPPGYLTGSAAIPPDPYLTANADKSIVEILLAKLRHP
jgi:hypothetical protein